MTAVTSLPLLADLDAIEIHTGMPLNGRRSPAAFATRTDTGRDPHDVLEELLIPALTRTPCAVAFSGGRDSSSILAAATDIARRHGLEDPVPLTFRFARHPRTVETGWQELTIRALGLSDWEILDLHDELDVVGGFARSVLERHGLYWPPNAHNLLPLLSKVAGGSLITGNGGDELLQPWSGWRLAQIRRGRARPHAYDLRPLGLSFLPAPVRRAASVRFSSLDQPWLREPARREFRRRWGEEYRFDPSWLVQMERYVLGRYRELVDLTFGTLADDSDVLLVEPFSDPRYVMAVARSGPRDGFASRDEAIQAHFGSLLPPEVATRSTKAVFTEVMVGPATADFVRNWDGSGVDHSLVDVDVLRRVWTTDRPPIQSMTMLQAAWLAANGRG